MASSLQLNGAARETHQYTTNTHWIIDGLASLRQEGAMCDAHLEVEHQIISAHKVVLAAASPYFKVIFMLSLP